MCAKARRRHDFSMRLAAPKTTARAPSFAIYGDKNLLTYPTSSTHNHDVMSNSITSNRSTLKEFLASITTIKGDLSNITAPPFVLGDYSTTELPQYFADHPSLFVAPALEENVEKRALLVLKNFLASLKNQQFAGRREEDGVKKPINAFLGEVFVGSWRDDEVGETRLVSEQVSHHPPVTACYLWNEELGISAEGFTQQEITFNGTVHIKQKGYAITRIDRYDEDYLIPMPNVKVKGVLTGTPYPELTGQYSIVSSSGLISEIKFEGKSLLGGGNRHVFEARMYRADVPSDAIYTVEGQWNSKFSIQDARTGQEIDTSDMSSENSIPITVPALSEQDPWESRKAWSGVVEALNEGDMKRTANVKSQLEEGQRQLRREEDAQNREWQRIFFHRKDHDPLFDQLSALDRESFTVDLEGGIWKVDKDAIDRAKRPFHGNLFPTGELSKKSTQTGNQGEGLDTERHAPTTEQQANGNASGIAKGAAVKVVNGNANGSANGHVNTNGGGIGNGRLTDVQVEEMLRAKYTSAPR
ncbi:hypothetical protein K458DRAFT_419997 [Lentithecium fluviatile CBS 122367]|uniref:Oxysterol-binding protein n=1 Tax=Lentithecium fluviatile CBS 122367 TaxID=1168545 RepID=A0A6G1IVQ3_9PLEO|nr:hypothetical protein K458DRAFT_419997 [Lentithecium fluviatile CBS 122367]